MPDSKSLPPPTSHRRGILKSGSANCQNEWSLWDTTDKKAHTSSDDWFRTGRDKAPPVRSDATIGFNQAEPAAMLNSENNSELPMTPSSSVRLRLVVTVVVTTTLALVAAVVMGWELWAGLLVGLAAGAAVWFGSGRFILQPARAIFHDLQRLANGELTSRTGLTQTDGEFGELARALDSLAASFEQRVREHDEAGRAMLNRAMQQTAVAALGQFALTGTDIHALFEQAVMLTTQTLDVEFCEVLEKLPGQDLLVLRTGAGWKSGSVDQVTVDADRHSQAGFTLLTGEPVVVGNLRTEQRFKPSAFLLDHGIVSGVTAAIATSRQPYGVLGMHTRKQRDFTGDEVQFVMAVASALALAVERSRNESELHKLAAFTQLNPNPALELARDGTVTYLNEAAQRLADSMEAEHLREILPTDIAQQVETCLATGESRTGIQTRVRGRTLSLALHPVTANGVVHCYVEDITGRLSLENQLRQSQKMESVGQLAAGVAHDFNNMLTIIQGHAGIVMGRPGLASEVRDSLQAINFASERAAGLTRQLLMFSRKSVMQSKPLNLCEVVANMSKMLHRLLGEPITLEFTPPPELPVVRADAGMIEQVVMNLAVNARDAMPKGGVLTISLSPIHLTEEYVLLHPEARAGRFVCLRVTDTGCGMDKQTASRIFEPFFTTKEVGKGTGLGLATVYGIVKQHEGWIEVVSEPGKGTTFSVLLPAGNEVAEAANATPVRSETVRGGSEGILVVEDEPVLRDMAHLILEQGGYRIYEAANGREALEVWDRHKEKIHLLFTDMVMPEGVSGVELAEKLRGERANLKIVFASGYTVDDISTEFLARNNHARFLQKPYTGLGLAQMIREALDARSAASSPPP